MAEKLKTEDIEPPMQMEVRQAMPEESGPRLMCGYSVGKKGETKEIAVGSMAGRGK